ncbi:putative ribosomal RNA large subunit methyltransferase J [Leptospira ryugenii]|uniref:Putative ribosomal RNA large subunit methyltransferase J n=1 Tax=Leptospira ryugenii TaxID=1917863 RepID=A0A2P2E2Y5_9LEPT|nr:TlyA family RNA methyltransferase [Leptospira ryugenii]GBF51265.1 putative ribosomal RNA large subunit methyltransferase J [Leptospira ryugenii]
MKQLALSFLDFQNTLPKEKTRLDEFLKLSDLIQDKNKIDSLILSGSILVNDRVVTKKGTLIHKGDHVRLRPAIKEYVSRGAFKLLKAFEYFPNLSCSDSICLDLGASTGGFTQVLLEKGAPLVYAIDVGYGQLAQRLANDEKVRVMDRTHIKDLQWKSLDPIAKRYFVTMDLSFISLTQVFPQIERLIRESNSDDWQGVSLVKPQFEVAGHHLESGILTDRRMQLRTVRNVWRKVKWTNPGFVFMGLCESPITGMDGNREFLLRWCWKA